MYAEEVEGGRCVGRWERKASGRGRRSWEVMGGLLSRNVEEALGGGPLPVLALGGGRPLGAGVGGEPASWVSGPPSLVARVATRAARFSFLMSLADLPLGLLSLFGVGPGGFALGGLGGLEADEETEVDERDMSGGAWRGRNREVYY